MGIIIEELQAEVERLITDQSNRARIIAELKKDNEKKDREIEDLEQVIDSLKDDIRLLEEEACDTEEEIYKARNESPFYDSDRETLEDSRKADLLKDHWESVSFTQLEGMLKAIGIIKG